MLAGKHILVLEDEPIIALDLAAAIADQHGVVVGPIDTIDEGLRLAHSSELHGAILDLRIRKRLALPVARALRRRTIPFVIHSGQADITLPNAWPDVPRLQKPAPVESVLALLSLVMNTNATNGRLTV